MKLHKVLRNLKLRTQVISQHLAEGLFKLLAKCHLVIEHKAFYRTPLKVGTPTPLSDIIGERFVYEASYVLDYYELVDEYWFTTRKGKKIFVMQDVHQSRGTIRCRAELSAFYAHFSHRNRRWVSRSSPVVYIQEDAMNPLYPTFDENAIRDQRIKSHRCDFSQCRYAFCLDFDSSTTIGEVISESTKQLKAGLTSKIPEINKILTGVDYDGEMMSPKNMPLSENILCKKCGLPVFASAGDKYRFECLEHGELDYPCVYRVDPVEYAKVLENTLEILENLIRKSCPKDSNL